MALFRWRTLTDTQCDDALHRPRPRTLSLRDAEKGSPHWALCKARRRERWGNGALLTARSEGVQGLGPRVL